MRVALAYPRHAADGGVEKNLDALAGFLAADGDTVDILCRRHGAAPHPRVGFVPMRSWLPGPWRSGGFARAVARQVARGGYDRVLAFGRTWPHDTIRLGMGCHQTYLERMAIQPGYRDRLDIGLEARSLAVASFRTGRRRVICNARLVANDVERRYRIDAEAITVIHNGADLARFHPQHRAAGQALLREAGIATDQPVAVFLGSGFARKGLDRCLAALARPAATGIALVVGGRDGDQDAFIARAQALGIAARVHFLGAVREPGPLLAAADCLVLPTRYDPFANVTIEALAAGAPVITTSDNGGGEILDPGVGVVLPDGDDAGTVAEQLAVWCARGRDPAVRTACRMMACRHDLTAVVQRTAAALRDG